MSERNHNTNSVEKNLLSNGADAVEIRVFWGDELLERVELSPPRTFVVGDASETQDEVDFTIPDAMAALGSAASALVRCDGGVPKLIVPEGARAVWRNERPAFGDRTEMVVEREVLLGKRAVDVHLSGLVFSIRMTEREARCPRAGLGGRDGRMLAFFGLSVLGNAALVASLMMSTPPFGLLDDDALDRDRVVAMLQYLDAAAEREEVPPPTPPTDSSGSGGPGATPSKGEAGTLGKPEQVARMRHASGTASGSNPSPATSKLEDVRVAQTFGMIGLLSSSAGAPTVAPWDDPGVGTQAFAGGFFGEIGEQNGSGGLTLTGLGSGGGDVGDSITMGGLGVCPNGFCAGLGRGGIGFSRGLAKLDHATRTPRIRLEGDTRVSGSLPREVIQRIVRQSFGRFRGCYEDGLRGNPNLEGRVTARFVIARDGSVASVQSGGSDLPDSRVVSCVLRAYTNLSFPAPKDGIVTVSYPLMFSPSA